MSLESVEVQCPYCGEIIEIEVEATSEPQNFVQDCSVCCHPIEFEAVLGEDGVEVDVRRSD